MNRDRWSRRRVVGRSDRTRTRRRSRAVGDRLMSATVRDEVNSLSDRSRVLLESPDAAGAARSTIRWKPSLATSNSDPSASGQLCVVGGDHLSVDRKSWPRLLSTLGDGADLPGGHDLDEPVVGQPVDVVVETGHGNVHQLGELGDRARLLQSPQDGPRIGWVSSAIRSRSSSSIDRRRRRRHTASTGCLPPSIRV